jgi:hypothetical protein
MAFAHVIPIPVRNVDRDIPFYHRLTTQSRVELKVGSLLHAVDLVVVHLRQIIHSVFHDNMAGGTRAASAAGMFEMKAEIHRHIEQRRWLSMPFIRHGCRVELKRLSGGKESNLGHIPIVAARL